MHIARTRKLLPAIFIVAAAIFASIPSAGLSDKLEIGFSAPDFSLTDAVGETTDLARISGERLTVLVFWSTWSANSPKALSRMETLYRQYRQQGLAVVGINVDGQRLPEEEMAAVPKTVAELELSIPILLDRDLTVFHDYGVVAVPSFVVFDGDLLVRYTLQGYPLIGSVELVDVIAAAMAETPPAGQVAQSSRALP